jgi:hypothetical protein
MAVADGADAVIAQGSEAGGHNRGTLGLFALLPRMIDAVREGGSALRKEQLAESKRVREESAQLRQLLREFKKGPGGTDFLRS